MKYSESIMFCLLYILVSNHVFSDNWNEMVWDQDVWDSVSESKNEATITLIQNPINGIQTEQTLSQQEGKILTILVKPKEGYMGNIEIDGE